MGSSSGMHRYCLPFQPKANSHSIISSESLGYRITVLTEGLVRLEWSPNQKFEDRASTFAVHRNLPTPQYRLVDRGQDGLDITTSRFRLSYDKKPFTPNGLTVQVLGSMTDYDSIWRYGCKVIDLGGTARTLDEVDGRTDLGPAVISRRGYALIDDSDTMLFDSEGWVAPRERNGAIDVYLFAYGHDYRAAIRALYDLSGSQPLLPRWALGNWWSRFYAYSERDYLELMDEFQRRHIPMSVAVVDMDWHLVKHSETQKAGVSGWTGYTWNKSLFPDPARFGRKIHERGLMLTLNDHPADGVHSYEEPYQAFARALDHDVSEKRPIPFDIANRRFCDAFFDTLHRQIEESSGCDFWWIDWQQGQTCRIPGIDPLWMLNHFHYLDNTRPGRHPLTFSRFAGPGSHRYPVGFSGDSVVSWDSLAFQPEFTNCASNIGYGWWSHDIGGHMHGKKDDELQTRWVQYGVFSPIMRLHSTANPWNTKEPWSFSSEHATVQGRFLNLRHKLVPYLQTMNVRAARHGLPLCQPMYWAHPEEDEAYEVPNQYMFGTSLIVAPITSPRSPCTTLARTKAWLPPGNYVDLFTGTVYQGNRSLWLHRTLAEYPVLAPLGSIIPFDDSEILQNGCPVPQHLEIVVIPGSEGAFDLMEEQPDSHGTTAASLKSMRKTELRYSQTRAELVIQQPTSGAGFDQSRKWTVRFHGCQMRGEMRLKIDGDMVPCVPRRTQHGFALDLDDVSSGKRIEVAFAEAPVPEPASHLDQCSMILSAAQIEYNLKEKIWTALTLDASLLRQGSRLHAIEMDKDVLDALLEQIYASGVLSLLPPGRQQVGHASYGWSLVSRLALEIAPDSNGFEFGLDLRLVRMGTPFSALFVRPSILSKCTGPGPLKRYRWPVRSTCVANCTEVRPEFAAQDTYQ